MNTYNVNIFVNDCCSSKCCTNNVSTTTNLNYNDNFIQLQNCFTLKILSVTESFVIVSISNNNVFFVRQLFPGVCLKLSLPANCACHIISIRVNSIENLDI